MPVTTPRTILDGLFFPEGPRWHDDALVFSDMHGRRVVRTDLDGDDETVVAFPDDDPSGLGWFPNGDMLVVGMDSRTLHRVDASGAVTRHADLSSLANGTINDMIVRADGTAYVGDMGRFLHDQDFSEAQPGTTILVTPEGEASIGAGDMASPNGHVLTPDESTLIVAESGGSCLTAYDVADDGTLSGRRVFAELRPSKASLSVAPPDGICLDEEGAVWVADPIGARVFRVREGGEVTDQIDFDGVVPVACVLGGPDRRTLLMCAAVSWHREQTLQRPTGRIDAVEVAVAGAGKP